MGPARSGDPVDELAVGRFRIDPDDLLARYPGDLKAQLRPSAELAVQLVGLPSDEAALRVKEAGFLFSPVAVPDDGRLALPANLVVGRIRGFVRDGVVRGVQVG